MLQHVQRVLRPVSVRNPYAEQLCIPKEVFKQRRTNAHYLAFIEVITFYHQYQRAQKVDAVTGEVYIETTVEDIRQANLLMREILLRKSDELNGATRHYLEQLKAWLEAHGQTHFTNAQVRSGLRIPLSTVKRYHLALVQAGHIERVADRDTRTHRYEIVSYEEYQRLQDSIGSVLDQITDRLSGPATAQRSSEPKKRVKAKTLA